MGGKTILSDGTAQKNTAAIAFTKGEWWVLIGGSVLYNVTAFAPAWFMLQTYNRVLPTSSVEVLLLLLGVLIVTVVISGAADWWRSDLLHGYADRYERCLAERVRTDRDRKVQSNDLSLAVLLLRSSVATALIDIPIVICMLPFFFWVNVWLGYLAGTLIVVQFAWAGMQYYRLCQDMLQQQHGGRVIRRLESYVSSISQQSVRQPTASVRQRIAEEKESLPDTVWLRRTQVAVKNFRVLCGSFMLGAAAGVYVLSGDMSAGMIIAISIMFGRLVTPMVQICSNLQMLLEGVPAYRRLRTLVWKPASPGLTTVQDGARLICTKLVTVLQASTNSRATVLHGGVTFSLEPGDTLLVAGQSGAGVTNLLRLVAHQTMPGLKTLEGSIRLGGSPLAQYSVDALDESIVLVSDRQNCLAGTIQDSLTGCLPVSESAVHEALRVTGLQATISGLPKGLMTEINQFGQPLSDGEYQRLLLASVLVRQPKVALLDGWWGHVSIDQICSVIDFLRQVGSIVLVAANRADLQERYGDVLHLKKGEPSQLKFSKETKAAVAAE